jgi:SM-20-related protein
MSKQNKTEVAQFEGLIQGLIDHQFGCCDNFLTHAELSGLRVNLAALSKNGNLKNAGIGNKHALHKDESIRGDQVKWIDEQSSNVFESTYLKKIWRFIDYLNQSCFTSILTFESHYANYACGAFYKRHLDQFKNEKGRKFSIVLYLNEDWKMEDEGLLSLYPELGVQQNISPKEGRLVFFRSDEMEHEVHPSPTRERNSIAGWMKN